VQGKEIRIGPEVLKVIVPMRGCRFEGLQGFRKVSAEGLAAGEVVQDDRVARAELGVHAVDLKRPKMASEVGQDLTQAGEDFRVGGVTGKN